MCTQELGGCAVCCGRHPALCQPWGVTGTCARAVSPAGGGPFVRAGCGERSASPAASPFFVLSGFRPGCAEAGWGGMLRPPLLRGGWHPTPREVGFCLGLGLGTPPASVAGPSGAAPLHSGGKEGHIQPEDGDGRGPGGGVSPALTSGSVPGTPHLLSICQHPHPGATDAFPSLWLLLRGLLCRIPPHDKPSPGFRAVSPWKLLQPQRWLFPHFNEEYISNVLSVPHQPALELPLFPRLWKWLRAPSARLPGPLGCSGR